MIGRVAGFWADGSLEDAVRSCERLAVLALNAYSRRLPRATCLMFRWTERSGGIGKFGQIVRALRPYGEQVNTPGRSSQMGRLR